MKIVARNLVFEFGDLQTEGEADFAYGTMPFVKGGTNLPETCSLQQANFLFLYNLLLLTIGKVEKQYLH